MVNFWKLSYKSVKEQRDQYKAENEKLRERNKKLEKRNNQKVRRYLRGGLQQRRIEDLESKYNGMIAERNSLIDDLSWYKANISRLERENEKFKEIKQEKEQFEESFQYQIEKRLEYFNKYQEHKALNNEISQHIGNKPSSSTYKYFREKLDNLGIGEDE